MAQYIGFVPGPADGPGRPMTIVAPTTATSTTTSDIASPNVTNQDMIGTHSEGPAEASPSLRATIGSALDSATVLAWKHRWELLPATAGAAITTLGWTQSASSAAGWEAAGWTVGALGAAAAAAHGLKHEHPVLFGASAGLGVAMADVAVATGAGFGAASMTVAAISTALAYCAYWPWLVRHRREQEAAAKRKTAAKADPDGEPDRPSPAGQATEAHPLDLPATAPALRGPFYDRVIPYADDDSDDVRDPIRLGWDEHGNPVLLTTLYRHTLVAGASDWGKSGIINLIIKKLLRKKHVELYGIDLKPGAPELGPWAPLFKKLARTPHEARALFDTLEAEAQRRGTELEQRTHRQLAAGAGPSRKWIPGDPSLPKDSTGWGHGTAVFVITDELGELVRQDTELRKQEAEARRGMDPEFAPLPEVPLPTRYESALAMVRFLGMQFISATQQPSRKIFGGDTDARGNYGNRLSTRAGEAGHARLVFGEGCRGEGFVPERLIRPGEFFIASSDHAQSEPPRCRAEYVSDDDIAADVAPYYQRGFVQDAPRRLELVRPEVPVDRVPAQAPSRSVVLFPDGTEVTRASHWLDLYKAFQRLCVEQGYATKDDLVEAGPYGARDTVRRALEVWLEHGVEVRKAGRFDQFYLPLTEGETTDEINDAEGAN